ncbi:MAG: asparagine synthase B [Solirubrobacterales bacterium]|nr:asparagine synthase B [Solirubrobacterales bacterium]
MCGIVGIHGRQPPVELGRRMRARLTHRGPDGEGEVGFENAWLGHRRLAIVDVAGGRQPLRTPDGELWMVGNGEVYNHKRLRAELLAGAEPRTESDNEVPLHLIGEHGPASLRHLRGMYALCAATEDGRFIAARDPVGIKPLFWARHGELVLFASELKAFDLDWQADVELFPPGHYWTPEGGLRRFHHVVPPDLQQRWDPPGQVGERAPEEMRAAIRNQLVAAIERELMSDVPVGVLLSGGLDSSLVAAIAVRQARRSGEPLHTFAVGTPDSPDLAAARRVAEHLGTCHHERVFEPAELVEVLPDVVRAIESYDPSLVRSALPNYLLAELAAHTVKVVLTGEGADELFAGYEYVRAIDDHGELHTELVRTISELHSLNLQRADRVTMAHGLEARVPFLDLDMVAFALELPPEWKLAAPGGQEKALLREAFEGWLPEKILWRAKAQFGDGSGARDALDPDAKETSTEELHAVVETEPGAPRSDEEARYMALYRRYYPRAVPERTMSLFATA